MTWAFAWLEPKSSNASHELHWVTYNRIKIRDDWCLLMFHVIVCSLRIRCLIIWCLFLKYWRFIIPNILRPLSSDQEHLWVGNWQRHFQGLSKQTQMAKTYHVLLFGSLDESSRNWSPWLPIEFALQTQKKEHSHHYNLSFSWGTCVCVCVCARMNFKDLGKNMIEFNCIYGIVRESGTPKFHGLSFIGLSSGSHVFMEMFSFKWR